MRLEHRRQYRLRGISSALQAKYDIDADINAVFIMAEDGELSLGGFSIVDKNQKTGFINVMEFGEGTTYEPVPPVSP